MGSSAHQQENGMYRKEIEESDRRKRMEMERMQQAHRRKIDGINRDTAERMAATQEEIIAARESLEKTKARVAMNVNGGTENTIITRNHDSRKPTFNPF